MLSTAFPGFRAAVLESEQQHGAGARVAVNTGFWGSGATLPPFSPPIASQLDRSGVLGPFLGLGPRLVARRIVHDGLGECTQFARALA